MRSRKLSNEELRILSECRLMLDSLVHPEFLINGFVFEKNLEKNNSTLYFKIRVIRFRSFPHYIVKDIIQSYFLKTTFKSVKCFDSDFFL